LLVLCCSIVQCAAVCCSVLQRLAACFKVSILKPALLIHDKRAAGRGCQVASRTDCSTLQHVYWSAEQIATHCNALQHVNWRVEVCNNLATVIRKVLVQKKLGFALMCWLGISTGAQKSVPAAPPEYRAAGHQGSLARAQGRYAQHPSPHVASRGSCRRI